MFYITYKFTTLTHSNSLNPNHVIIKLHRETWGTLLEQTNVLKIWSRGVRLSGKSTLGKTIFNSNDVNHFKLV